MKEKLLDKVIVAVQKMLGEDYTVQHARVVKNNDTVYECCQIRKSEECIMKSIGIDRMLCELELGGQSIMAAAEEIVNLYYSDGEVQVQVKQCAPQSKEDVLKHLVYCVINRERNTEYLKDKVYREFLDLAVTYRVIVNQQEDGIATYAVTNSQCKALGICMEELEAAAKKNLESEDFRVQALDEVLAALTGCDEFAECPVKLWVCTNQTGISGARVMLADKCFRGLAERLRDDLLILPSSVHEVIVLQMKEVSTVGIQDVQNMVREVNTSAVMAVDILGDSVYLYSRKTGEISIIQEGK